MRKTNLCIRNDITEILRVKHTLYKEITFFYEFLKGLDEMVRLLTEKKSENKKRKLRTKFIIVTYYRKYILNNRSIMSFTECCNFLLSPYIYKNMYRSYVMPFPNICYSTLYSPSILQWQNRNSHNKFKLQQRNNGR